jgi:hypothetical protein
VGRRVSLGFCLAALASCAIACSSSSDGTTGDEDDLTSITARARKLSFEGVVYVAPDASDTKILETIRHQTQSAFGALLNAKVAVRDRELHDVDPKTFVKKRVSVIDAGGAGGKTMLEVRYVYDDDAVVPIEMARHTAMSLGLLASGGDGHEQEILVACTVNDKEAKDDIAQGFVWYDWNPGRSTCRKAMTAEQKVIDAAEASLTDKRNMVSKARAERVYLPTTMSFARADNATAATYPEYDKLFTGGVEKDTLVVTLLDGRLSHEHTSAVKDDGYPEWMTALDVVFKANPDFVFSKIEPAENLETVQVNGHKYSGLKFTDFIQWELYGNGWPAGMPAADRDDIAALIAQKLDGHWVTFEKKVKVSIDDKPAKDFTIKLKTLFGCDEDPTPHQQAVKTSDVVIYNGHSYIGYGPLDPDNFKAESFPASYQMLFFDSCVSYNYYEKDFFVLKPGGSKNLDLITNGIEAPEYLSGDQDGHFIARLIDGSMPSYQNLLEAAKKTDSLRVVDGEVDNKFRPDRTKIRISK